MFDDLSKRAIFLWIIFLLIGSLLSAWISYWAAEKVHRQSA
jgi:membrane protein DedA with SNARE-associated domain